MVIDVLDRDDLPFPNSLPEFQRLFPNEAACAAYLERARWSDGFICPHCGTPGEPYRYATRPRCSLLPEVPARSPPHCWHRHGAHTSAAHGLVLGGVSGCQSDAGHVGRAVPTATRIVALRD